MIPPPAGASLLLLPCGSPRVPLASRWPSPCRRWQCRLERPARTSLWQPRPLVDRQLNGSQCHCLGPVSRGKMEPCCSMSVSSCSQCLQSTAGGALIMNVNECCRVLLVLVGVPTTRARWRLEASIRRQVSGAWTAGATALQPSSRVLVTPNGR